MDCLFEAILQIFAELFLGAAIEILSELIGRAIGWVFEALFGGSVARTVATAPVRAGQVVLWLLAGIGVGAISLLVVPHPLIKGTPLHVLNLILSPFLMAAALVAWGRLLAKYDHRRTPLNHFACAYAFALSYLLVRFCFTH
jgi:hypothetical protein